VSLDRADDLISSGLLTGSVGLAGHPETILAPFAAVVCATLLTTLTRLVNGSRIYSRQIWTSSSRREVRDIKISLRLERRWLGPSLSLALTL